jgi:cytochrome b561
MGMQLTDDRSGYGWVSIALHWAVAGLVVYLYFNGEAFVGLPRGPEAGALRRLHNSWGMLVLVLIAARIVWRLWQGSPEKGRQASWLNVLAAVVHWSILAALVVVCATGVVNIWSGARPIEIFGVLSLPSPMTRDGPLHEWTEHVHSIAAHALIPLVALHVLGGLKHAVVDRDGVFWRIFRPAR